MTQRAGERRFRILVVLWLIVVLELISPVPLVLTFGAAYVLVVRPRWFHDLVRELYGTDGEDG